MWEPDSWPQLERSLPLEARYCQLGLEESFEQYAAAMEGVIAGDLAADLPV